MQLLQATKKYAVFSGRASRSEFWYHFLFLAVGGVITSLIHPILYLVFALGLMIPSISVLVRRLHDIGKSGWFYWIILIPFVGAILMLVWVCKKGTEGENDYGSDPLVTLEDASPKLDDQASS